MRKFAHIVLSILLTACSAANKDNVDSTPAPEEADAPLKHVATVQFDDTLTALVEEALAQGSLVTKSSPLDAVLQEMGVESLERVFPYAGEFEERTRREGLHRFYHVTFRADVPETKAAEGLATVPGVLHARPEHAISLRSTFNDPYYSKQWNLANGPNGSDINVQAVWDRYTTGSQSVIVCVVDEPVDPSHEDLKANLWKDADGHTGYNFARNSYDLSIRSENGDGDIGHGTHVAGVIAAVNDNGKGVCGVAGGDAAMDIPGVRVQSCAIFSGQKSATDKQSANAIKWGADHGALISQNSWGYTADGILGEDPDGTITDKELEAFRSLTINAVPDFKAAIDYFIKYAGCDNNGNQLPDSPMKGGLVIFAAGNENIDHDIISTYEPVVAVGASNRNNRKASYSNYGSWVDIAAPGGEKSDAGCIWSTLPLDPHISTTGYGGKDWAGTSMACPHASGVAALIVSYFGGPDFTADRCKEILLGGLEEFKGDKPLGKKLDALTAFEYGIRTSGGDVPPQLIFSETDVQVKAHQTRTINVLATGNATIRCVDAGSPALSFDAQSGTITLVGRAAPAGNYNAAFVATSPTGMEATGTLTYTLLPNHAPTVVKSPGNIHHKSLTAATTLVLSDYFEDQDGEELTCTLTIADESVAYSSASAGKVNLYSRSLGLTDVTLTATDGLGESATIRFKLAVTDPTQPVRPNTNVVTSEMTIDINAGTQTQVDVVVYNANGQSVLQQTRQGDVFNPVQLDLTSLSPGRYTLRLSYNSNTYSVPFVKI